MLFKLALKIIKYRKKSYIFTIIGIAFGIGLLISSNFLFNQLEKSTEQAMIVKYGDADLRIGYRQGKLLSEKEIALINNEEYFESTSQVITNPQQFSADFDTTNKNRYYIAVDNHNLSKRVYHYHKSINLDEVILTQRLATKLKAKIGQFVTIPINNQQSLKKKVIEVIPNIDDPSAPEIILFNINSIKDELGIKGNANLVLGKLNPKVNSKEVITYLRNNSNKNLVIDEVAEFDEVKKNVYSLKLLSVGLGALIVILSGLLFLNNFQLSLRSREKELATMRMIGANKKHILKLIMSEALIINSIGVFLGVLLSIIFSIGFEPLLESNFNIEINFSSFNPILIGLICFGCWLFITVLSLVPALQASRIPPVQAYMKANYSRVKLSKTKKIIFVVLLLFGAGSLIVESILMEIARESRTSILGFAGSLVFILGLLMCITYSIPSILRFIQPMFVKLGGKESVISFKNFNAERKQNSKVIQIIALSISLSILIPSVLQLLKLEMEQNATKIYVTDIVASSSKFINSTIPKGIMEEVDLIEEVNRAIPISTLSNLRLYNYDFSKADPKWLEGKDESIYAKRNITEKESLPFVYSNLLDLQEQGIIDGQNKNPVNSLVVTKKTANQLGIKVGDKLSLGNLPYSKGDEGLIEEVKVTSVISFIPGDGFDEGVIIDQNNPILAGTDVNIRSILIDTDDNKKSAVFDGLESISNGYPELYWSSLEKELAAIDKQINERFVLLWIILAVTIFISLFGVMNAINANLQNSRREYAVLRAISLDPTQISSIIFTTSFIFNLLGSLFGIVIGIVLTYGLSLALNTNFYVSFNYVWIIIILVFLLTRIMAIPIANFIKKRSVLTELNYE